MFLEQIEQVITWLALLALVTPYYPEGKTWRSPVNMQTKGYLFMQQRLTPSGPTIEDAFVDVLMYREFANSEKTGLLLYEESTLRLRDHLEKHKLSEEIKSSQNEILIQPGLLRKTGNGADRNVTWHVAMRPGNRKVLKHADELMKKSEKLNSGIRVKVEHPFRVIKHQFGYMKTSYRGLMKNAAQIATLFALSGLWMARHDLTRARV